MAKTLARRRSIQWCASVARLGTVDFCRIDEVGALKNETPDLIKKQKKKNCQMEGLRLAWLATATGQRNVAATIITGVTTNRALLIVYATRHGLFISARAAQLQFTTLSPPLLRLRQHGF